MTIRKGEDSLTHLFSIYGYKIFRCNGRCLHSGHYHCCYCSKVIGRLSTFLNHLKKCKCTPQNITAPASIIPASPSHTLLPAAGSTMSAAPSCTPVPTAASIQSSSCANALMTALASTISLSPNGTPIPIAASSKFSSLTNAPLTTLGSTISVLPSGTPVPTAASTISSSSTTTPVLAVALPISVSYNFYCFSHPKDPSVSQPNIAASTETSSHTNTPEPTAASTKSASPSGTPAPTAASTESSSPTNAPLTAPASPSSPMDSGQSPTKADTLANGRKPKLLKSKPQKVACAFCNMIISKKNMKVHIQRRHSSSLDIIAHDLLSECVEIGI
ncbi:mucin-2-like isoform X2 [Corythoichthys intestinalis]|uniref:mucin-2-like isoform X2 n=1 Tax=Corythoichthys intestinalis TaxID=161448 RepID=UPI0025A593DA|nr:mucin-2-like isoform X2 [Corythoichthys intestinalis]